DPRLVVYLLEGRILDELDDRFPRLIPGNLLPRPSTVKCRVKLDGVLRGESRAVGGIAQRLKIRRCTNGRSLQLNHNELAVTIKHQNFEPLGCAVEPVEFAGDDQ